MCTRTYTTSLSGLKLLYCIMAKKSLVYRFSSCCPVGQVLHFAPRNPRGSKPRELPPPLEMHPRFRRHTIVIGPGRSLIAELFSETCYRFPRFVYLVSRYIRRPFEAFTHSTWIIFFFENLEINDEKKSKIRTAL